MGSKRGFTLIELAIVLIVIGIIITMVIKGQEMIRSTQIKKLQDIIENGIVQGFIDCRGYSGIYPGDTDADFVIEADPLDTAACTTKTCECFRNKKAVTPLVGTHSVQIGNKVVYIYVGSEDDPGRCGNPNVTEPVIALCADATCSQSFAAADPDTNFYINLVQNLDAYLDDENNPVGVADDTAGYIIGGSVTITSNIVSAVTPDSGDTTKEWDGTETALIYCLKDI